jgi:hypothetical protein
LADETKSGGEGHVSSLPSFRDMARGLRRCRKRARVERAPLHSGTRVAKPLRGHDLRATDATWLSVEGKGPTEIRDVRGHTQTSVTDRYLRAAAMLRGGRFGGPFPALPESLSKAPATGPKKLPLDRGQFKLAKPWGFAEDSAGRTGLEPAASGVTGRRYNQLNYRPRRSLGRNSLSRFRVLP